TNIGAMGFLSRKPKPAPIQVDEQHPIVEELQRMEEAVPERAVAESPAGHTPQAAGPVVDEHSSSSQAAGEERPSTPPPAEAQGAEGSSASVEAPPAPVEPAAIAPAPVAPPVVKAEPAPPEEPARMMPRDLIAPSRLDTVRELQAEPEVPVKHADVIAFANQKGGVAKTTTTLN